MTGEFKTKRRTHLDFLSRIPPALHQLDILAILQHDQRHNRIFVQGAQGRVVQNLLMGGAREVQVIVSLFKLETLRQENVLERLDNTGGVETRSGQEHLVHHE